MAHVWIVEWYKEIDKKWFPYSFWLTERVAEDVKKDMQGGDSTTDLWRVRKYERVEKVKAKDIAQAKARASYERWSEGKGF